MNEPETTSDETGGERGERVVDFSLRPALDFDLGDVGAEPAVGPVEGENADTAVACARVGLDEQRTGTRVVNYLSILRL